jgi:hypothetical protein
MACLFHRRAIFKNTQMKQLFFAFCLVIFCAATSNAQMVSSRIPVSYSKVAPTLKPILGTTSHLWYNSSVNTASALQVYDRVAGTWYAAAVKKADASATLDFPSTSANLTADLGIRVPGAVTGDKVVMGLPKLSGALFNSYVTTDTVWIRFHNASAGTVNPAAATFNVSIIR